MDFRKLLVPENLSHWKEPMWTHWHGELLKKLRFVVLDDVLYVSDVSPHDRLVFWAVTGELDDSRDVKKLIKQERMAEAAKERVVAAGACTSTGEVIEWHSHGLDVETPDHLRKEIQEMLKRLALTP
ncbi:MAG: hypothetical protein HY420_02445 [Candidatus Kerfeldbacteria bacterium]|nr:hypothetical protein [Candidatus Kerfeldbacteria bacterium]